MTDFEETVLRMRNAQREYFRTRSVDALRESKALEKQVDAMLRDLQTPQMKLGFEEEGQP